MWIQRIARHLAALIVTTLIAGLLGATLVRFGPGFETDEQQLDPRLNARSIQAIQQSHLSEHRLLPFYVHFLARMVSGDLGVSRSLARPVTELLLSRVPVTLQLMAAGILGGWLLGLALAFSAVAVRNPVYDFVCTAVSSLFLCVPTAILALVLFFAHGPARFSIALLIFPKVYRYARNLFADAYTQPHVLAARARGLSGARILFHHVTPWVAPQLFALAGVSLGVAFGAAIPIEVLCDLPGIGQLAWTAALARDLPVLVSLTLLVAAVTQLANAASDVAIAASTRQSA
jgi:peptide/nickel transport system permease protein